MKKNLPALLLLHFSFVSCYAATITWTGASGSNWNNTANWSTATVPGANDDVLFNTSVTVSVDLIPATNPFIYLINSLRITGNASVTLSRIQAGGGIRLLQVKSTSAITPGLRIDNGSTLTINAGNASGTLTYALDLTGAAGVTGQVYGNLYFTGTGAGSGDAGLNLYSAAANYASLAVKSTGVIKYFTNSGNTSSTAGAYLIMESGSTYEINKNGGSLPNGNWDDNSNVLVTGATTNGDVYFNQYQYGNIKWDTPLMTSAIQLINTLSPVTSISVNNFTITNTNGKEIRLKTGTGSTIYDYTVRGNLSIASTGILVISGNTVTTAGAGGRLHVMGNLSNAGVLKSDGAAGTINDLELSGSSNQTISNTGTFAGTQLKLIMNNAAGATLLTPLILPGTTTTSLQLNNGKIKTTSAAILTMPDNANYSGGSTASFIDGPMNKTGDDETFSFPVGKGSIYAPINYYCFGMAVTDNYQAEYFRVNPQTIYGVNYETPINHVSYLEYWRLAKTVGSTAIAANITLTVTEYSFAKDLNSLYVARYNSADLQWKNSGIAFRSAGTPVPPYITGSITSAPITQSGIFTLASSLPELINPLPVTLISFNAVKVNDSKSKVTWETTTEIINDVKFEIERSVNGKEFMPLKTIAGNSTGRPYIFYDDLPGTGIISYRLKIIGADGKYVYSSIASLNYNSSDWFVTLFPNPVSDNSVININSSVPLSLTCIIYDVSGKEIQQWNSKSIAGSRYISLQTGLMKRGIYFLSVTDGKTKKITRFIKM